MPTTTPSVPQPKLRKMRNIPLPPGLKKLTPEANELRAYLRIDELRPPPPGLPRLSVNEIVPEDLQNKLMGLEFTLTRAYFEIGDIANDLIGYVPQLTRDGTRVVTQQDVFDAVGYFCHRAGRTVRYYAETAEFYPLEVRAEFDMLPFGHFVVARSFGSRWKDVLEYAREHISLNEDTLKQYFSQLGLDVQGAQDVYEGKQNVIDTIEAGLKEMQVGEDAGFPVYSFQPKKSSNVLLISHLSSLIDTLERVLDRVDASRRERVVAILSDVRVLILEVQADLSASDVV